jgi:hypothetical protein
MGALEQCLQQFAEAQRQMLCAYSAHGGIAALAEKMNQQCPALES